MIRPLQGIRTWVVYYADAAEAAADLARFDLVVLDPVKSPPLPAVKRHGALVLMYLSLGEVNVNHPEFARIANEPWVLDANPEWPEARRLDVRAKAWKDWVSERLVPPALRAGVNGLFFDTVDTALALEAGDPARFGGAGAAVEALLRDVRARHPRALLVLNGGVPLAARSPALVDGVTVESVWTDYDFAAKRYLRRDDADAARRATRLEALAARGVPVLTLEYAPGDDADWIKTLIGKSRARGFVPYVSTIGLDRVFEATLR
ncbi:MAG: endo alpha-1,4 polygalactosaminidase [Candidatus Rokubacteria bacterium]|nr:endo alpha-1,4 polygalactosaminidase [Candidatus Rokubacteria bacterium]